MDLNSLFSSSIGDKDSKGDKLLQKQQISQEKINQLLEQSAQALMCGPTCQKLKTTDELQQKYLNAQTNVKTAPIKLEQSKKNFYTFTEGSAFYSNMQEEELKKKAEEIADQIKTHFNDELENANTMNQYLNTATINSNYTKELLAKYVTKNQELKDELRSTRGDILTNDRKTYYETDALNTLESWYKFMLGIYYLLAIVLLIFFVTNWTVGSAVTSLFKKIIVFILVFFYPFYIHYVLRMLSQFFAGIYNKLPKNVYNSL